MILVDGAVGGFATGDAESDFALLRNVLENRPDQTDVFVRKVLFHRPQPKDYITRLISEANRVPANSAVALRVGYFAEDYRSVLAKIHRPTLIVAAKSDYTNVLFDMRKQIPGSQIAVLDGVGHRTVCGRSGRLQFGRRRILSRFGRPACTLNALS